MKKIIKVENIDCANCAAKFEREINKIDGVNSASVNFLTQKVILDLDENKKDKVLYDIVELAKKSEPDWVVRI